MDCFPFCFTVRMALLHRWKVLQSSMDDRYQQLCGVTRDGALSGPLLHSFLASSVERPWERSITEADVPYYVK